MSYIVPHAATTRADNGRGSDDLRASNGVDLEGRSYLDVNGANVGFDVGIYAQPLGDDTLRLGLSYTSRPGLGATRLSGALRLLTRTGAAFTDQTDQVDLLESLPDVIRAGVAYRVTDQTELRLDGEHVRWSVFQNQCVVQAGASCPLNADGSDPGRSVVEAIQRNWKDTFAFRLGVTERVSPVTEVFVSGGVDTSAVPTSTLGASLPDSTKIRGSFGVRRAFGPRLVAALSGNEIYYLPVDNADSQLFTTYRGVSQAPSGNGNYTGQVFYLNANVTLLF